MFDPKNPFETFQHSAFRLEGLPVYRVDEEKCAFDHFLATGEALAVNAEWATLVATNIAAGKKMERLRLFSRQLTDYERFETQAYNGPTAGEVIRTATREDYEKPYRYDFWMFDEQWIAQMVYEDDGSFVNMLIREATSEDISHYDYWRNQFEAAKPIKKIPFFSNTIDDTHCLPAAYMSIAAYFDPGFKMNIDDWSRVCGYEDGLGTWANAGLLWFHQQGYDVIHYELFDNEEFIKRPEAYMIEVHGKEVGHWAIEHTNIPAEIERIKAIQATDIMRQHDPTLEDVRQLIDDGYLVRIAVNAHSLNGELGYEGHAIVIFDYNDHYVLFHDPGLPAVANRQKTFKELEAAWTQPGRELDAVKKRD